MAEDTQTPQREAVDPASAGSGLRRCPICNAPEHEADVPGIHFDCLSTIRDYANNHFIRGVRCHTPNPSESIADLYEHEITRWRWRKSTVLAKEIESWEKHFQRHSQAYAVGGASKTPPGVLPDGDKLRAIKEAYKQAKEREDYNALVEAHFLPTPAKPSRPPPDAGGMRDAARLPHRLHADSRHVVEEAQRR